MTLKITMDTGATVQTEYDGDLNGLEKYFAEPSKCGSVMKRIGKVFVNIHHVRTITKEN